MLEATSIRTAGRVLCLGERESLSQAISELEKEGFEIILKATAEEMLREAGKAPPVAFLLAGGEESPALCRRLRGDVRHAFTPLFVLSAQDPALRLSLVTAGADDCGPFPPRYLGQAIRARRERLEVLKGMAFQDGLTGLLTAEGLKSVLPREIARARRYRSPFCFAIIDVDGLRRWNEAYGHGTGDALLAAMGEAFRYGLRDADVVARVGGDEFVVLFPHAKLDGARVALERCRQLFLAIPICAHKSAVRGAFSAGISQLRDEDKNGRELLERAGQALLSAKREGGDRIAVEAPPTLAHVS